MGPLDLQGAYELHGGISWTHGGPLSSKVGPLGYTKRSHELANKAPCSPGKLLGHQVGPLDRKEGPLSCLVGPL